MKTLKSLILTIGLFIAVSTQAQVQVNINGGSPPMWGPAGYSDVQYYYLPDVYSYYDVRSSMFIYQSGGAWVHRKHLPSRYRNYDLYNGYKVVMKDYHGNRPYDHYRDHKMKYAKGYRGPEQRNIGERPRNGYSGAKGHSDRESEHREVRNNGHSKSEGRGQGNGNEKKGNNHGEGHGKKK